MVIGFISGTTEADKEFAKELYAMILEHNKHCIPTNKDMELIHQSTEMLTLYAENFDTELADDIYEAFQSEIEGDDIVPLVDDDEEWEMWEEYDEDEEWYDDEE